MEPRIKGLETVSMTTARTQLPELTSSVESNPQRIIEFCRREKPAAYLVSQERFGPLFEALQPAEGEFDPINLLVWMVVERWLGTAPSHLKAPQSKELRSLSLEQLLTVAAMDPEAPALEGVSGAWEKVLRRLIKRRDVAKAIARAEAQGLYEASEHLAGNEHNE